MNQRQFSPRLVALIVRVVEALADLHDDEAGLGNRHGLALVAIAIEDRAQVSAVNVLERDVVRALFVTEIKHLSDVRVVELDRNLCLVDKHLDELFVLGNVGEDSFDRDKALKSLHTKLFGAKDFRHTSYVDALEEIVFAEWNGLVQGRTFGSRRDYVARRPRGGEKN